MKRIIVLALLLSIVATVKAQTAIPEFKNKVMILTKNNSLEPLESTNLVFLSKGTKVSVGVESPTSSVVYNTKDGSSFIIKIAPGVDPESVITLYKFSIRKEKRKIDIVSGSFSGPNYKDQQIIKLGFKKVEDGVYIISADLLSGEYYFGVREPGMAATIPMSSGFAFSVRD